MSTPTNHWKLGLFVVVGFVLALVTVVALGARSMKKEVVGYETFFDESVQGLEVGSPVKFRGVTIGYVSSIDIAVDHRHVDVTSDLAVKDLKEMGLAAGKGTSLHLDIPSGLRMQLASQGITGVKFMQIDFFDEKDNPPPLLPFAAPKNYIPAAVSTLKNLEDAIVHAVNRVPEVADQLLTIMTRVDGILVSLEGQKIPEQTSATLTRVNEVLASLQSTVKGLDTQKLSGQAQATLANLNGTVSRMNAMLEKIDGDKGLLANANRASTAIGDVAAGASGVGRELERTLHDIQQLTAALQRVAEALDRDPDMFVKGRSKKR
jgi:paraquat-inducible protein B